MATDGYAEKPYVVKLINTTLTITKKLSKEFIWA